MSALQREYRCSYASVTIRLAEVLRDLPLMAVLYERKERGNPEGWTEPAILTARVVKRTAGFGPRRCRLICGRRGGMPRNGKAIPPGSLAEVAAQSGRAEYAEGDGLAVIATPVFWKGRLAKVVLVTVPWERRSVLEPQLGRRRQSYPWSNASPATAVP